MTWIRKSVGLGTLAGLLALAASAAHAGEAGADAPPTVAKRAGVVVPTPHFTYDVGGGDLNTVQVTFDLSTSSAGIAGLFYRVTLELNADCPPALANRNVVTGAAPPAPFTLIDLGVAPNTVIDPGPNGVLETVPNTDASGLPTGGDDVIFTLPPPSNRSVILAGANLIAETQVRQNIVVASGAAVVPGGNCAMLPPLGPGPAPQTGPRIETIPQGDDVLGVDAATGMPVILAGPNARADTYALPGVIIRSGPDPFVQTPANNLHPPPLGDDILVANGDPETGNDIIVDGGNFCVDTIIPINPDGTAQNNDVQWTRSGFHVSNDIQVNPVGTRAPLTGQPPPYLPPNTFTDDIQVTPLGLVPATANPALDTGVPFIDQPTYDGAIATPLVVDYSLPTLTPFQVDQIVCVRLRIAVALDANGTGMVEATFVRQVRLTLANFPPNVHVDFSDSTLNFQPVPLDALFNMDSSFDQDGYFPFGAFEFGDERTQGNAIQLFPPSGGPPDLQALPGNYGDFGDGITTTTPHTYDIAGNYKARLSLIDNGRIPLATGSVFAPVTALPPAGATEQELQVYFNSVLLELKLLQSQTSFTPVIANAGVDMVLSASTTVVISGDDFMGVDGTGQTVIVDGGNRIAESTVRAIIDSGADGVIDGTTFVGGDDFIFTTTDAPYVQPAAPNPPKQYVVDGGNGLVESIPSTTFGGGDDTYLGGFTNILQTFPPPDDAAWDEVQVVREGTPTGPAVLPGTTFAIDPMLRQHTIQVNVKGNMAPRTAGRFSNVFAASPDRDALSFQTDVFAFQPGGPVGVPLTIPDGTPVQVTLRQPSSMTDTIISTGTVVRGRYRAIGPGLSRSSFSFNARTRRIAFSLSRADALEASFDIFNTLTDPTRLTPLAGDTPNLKFGAAVTTVIVDVDLDGGGFGGAGDAQLSAQFLYQYRSTTRSGVGTRPIAP
ncbi:MAG: hypothetical protein M5U26_01075 [Planctomycetota bacterium]|nr:hypothetical protein [Planctomycetota bacterium]